MKILCVRETLNKLELHQKARLLWRWHIGRSARGRRSTVHKGQARKQALAHSLARCRTARWSREPAVMDPRHMLLANEDLDGDLQEPLKPEISLSPPKQLDTTTSASAYLEGMPLFVF